MIGGARRLLFVLLPQPSSPNEHHIEFISLPNALLLLLRDSCYISVLFAVLRV